MKQGRWQRGIAIFFLMFTFIDLTFPQLCADEMVNLSIASSAKSAKPVAVISAASVRAAHDKTEAPAQPIRLEEDCFCCCSHLLLGYAPDAAALGIKPPASDPQIDFLPSAPPRGTFHPPRFA